MTTEHVILGGAAIAFVLALIYAATRKGTMATIGNIAATLKPIEQAASASLGGAFKSMDAQAVEQGFAALERQIVESLAAGHTVRLQDALAPKAPAAPTPPPAS